RILRWVRCCRSPGGLGDGAVPAEAENVGPQRFRLAGVSRSTDFWFPDDWHGDFLAHLGFRRWISRGRVSRPAAAWSLCRGLQYFRLYTRLSFWSSLFSAVSSRYGVMGP